MRRYFVGIGSSAVENVERYTESIDAALTLVGEKIWMVNSDRIARIIGEDGKTRGYGAGTNPAIALCVAALRARE